jgi:3-hydroxy-9,10-secoandrosta-1,3,5(10)-triene-9,17-dione monooxygenase reductase component
MNSIRPDETRSFRKAPGASATGVTVETTSPADCADVGLTANSFNSVSLDPPVVLWSLASFNRACPFCRGAYFTVHVLAADQEAIPRASADAGQVRGPRHRTGPGDTPCCASTRRASSAALNSSTKAATT